MTTETTTTPTYGGVQRAATDALAMTKRNLLKYVRIPTLLLFSTIQPVMFVLLFVFVFGGAVQIAGATNYATFLLPGIFIQTAVFGSTNTGIGLAEDINKGIIDRFRSLPMSRSAVLVGRTLSDACRNIFVVILMTIVGYMVGFRFEGSFVQAVLALFLAVLFGFAFSWISAAIGLSVRDVETAQAAGFIWVFPLTFASSAFVPTETMPTWLQGFADINPVTVAVNTLRALTYGQSPTPDLWWMLAWVGGILAVFIPLSVRAYRKAV
jgi:ABC-2 type transport system permease protein/oleandomycin transport system permease protein